MRIVVQRVSNAKCVISKEVYSRIEQGFLVLVGFTFSDTQEDIELLAKKVASMRIFEDDNGKINRCLKDVNGEIMAISQFTLYADCKKGNRPSFSEALSYDLAEELYQLFCERLRAYDLLVQTGIFGADMKLEFTNDGPVTIILDSNELK